MSTTPNPFRSVVKKIEWINNPLNDLKKWHEDINSNYGIIHTHGFITKQQNEKLPVA